jgi:hypothetical protein
MTLIPFGELQLRVRAVADGDDWTLRNNDLNSLRGIATNSIFNLFNCVSGGM